MKVTPIDNNQCASEQGSETQQLRVSNEIDPETRQKNDKDGIVVGDPQPQISLFETQNLQTLATDSDIKTETEK